LVEAAIQATIFPGAKTGCIKLRTWDRSGSAGSH
jgi:hypothetical protein